MKSWRPWAAVLALGLLAWLATQSFWPLQRERTAAAPDAAADASRGAMARAEMEEVELVGYGASGAVEYRLRAHELREWPDPAGARFIGPQWQGYPADGGFWRADAKQAWLSPDHARVHLTGAVLLSHTDSGGLRTTLETDALWIEPAARRAHTDAAVLLARPGWRAQATGLRADLAAQTWQLLHAVDTRHDPAG